MGKIILAVLIGGAIASIVDASLGVKYPSTASDVVSTFTHLLWGMVVYRAIARAYPQEAL